MFLNHIFKVLLGPGHCLVPLDCRLNKCSKVTCYLYDAKTQTAEVHVNTSFLYFAFKKFSLVEKLRHCIVVLTLSLKMHIALALPSKYIQN